MYIVKSLLYQKNIPIISRQFHLNIPKFDNIINVVMGIMKIGVMYAVEKKN